MKLVWTVRKEGRRCTFEHFSEAWADWQSHPGEIRWLYPRVITERQWLSLSDFTGW